MFQAIIQRIKSRSSGMLQGGTRSERYLRASLLGIVYALPLVLLGVVWLTVVTNWNTLWQNWPFLLAGGLLQLVFSRLVVYSFEEYLPATFMSYEITFESLIPWSLALIFGPVGLWPAFFVSLATSIAQIPRYLRMEGTGLYTFIANRLFDIAGFTFCNLAGLWLFTLLGGVFPLAGFDWPMIAAALIAVVLRLILGWIIYLPYLVAIVRSQPQTYSPAQAWQRLRWFLGTGLSTPYGLDFFGIIAAGMYTSMGWAGYLFMMSSLLLAAFLANRFSHSLEHSRLRSRELDALARLGMAVLNSPPDQIDLPGLMKENVAGMFPQSRIQILLYAGNQTLLDNPEAIELGSAGMWQWLLENPQSAVFRPGETLPWGGREDYRGILVCPVLDQENQKILGGIWISRGREPQRISDLLPAARALAGQIASALNASNIYHNALARHRLEQELELAGSIQSTFLPESTPDIPGLEDWQVFGELKPARETSGDFYDLISLPNQCLGIVVADVADKGMGAALYMALSRTLIRTYALEYHNRPDFVMRVANMRILTDTRADQFVTVFYAVLDLKSGQLIYCNAGHNPPILICIKDGCHVTRLTRTGIPLGIYRDQVWESRSIQVSDQDVLVMFTDGITEAQNESGEFYGDERLIALVQSQRKNGAGAIKEAILKDLESFIGRAQQSDDFTLLVVARQSPLPE
jgi:serine phosphatase RsbU (regulator of sigma subunit)